MAGEPRVCNYIDVPLQHASDAVLRRMGRGVTRLSEDPDWAAGRIAGTYQWDSTYEQNTDVLEDGQELVFVEPLAAAFQIMRQVKLTASDRVVVLGDGRLAQLVVRVLRMKLKRTLMVGRHPAKLEAAEKELAASEERLEQGRATRVQLESEKAALNQTAARVP